MPRIQYFLAQLALIALGFLGMHVAGGGKVPTSREGFVMSIGYFSLAGLIFAIAVRSFPQQRNVRVWELLGCLAVGLVGSAVFTPVWLSANVASTTVACAKRARTLNMSLLTYALEHDERLPGSANWQSVTEDFRSPGVSFKCPSSHAAYAYAFNSHLAFVGLSQMVDASKIIVIFESESGAANLAGGQEVFVTRHSGAGTLGLGDGFVRRARKGDLTYQWKPDLADFSGP